MYRSVSFYTNGNASESNVVSTRSKSDVKKSLPSPSSNRRFAALSVVPEKDEANSQKPQVYPVGQVFKKTIKIAQLERASPNNVEIERSSPPPMRPCHLSPKTLRRLEQKHHLAKLQQSLQIGASPANSPPASPQMHRRVVFVKRGVENRRFTVARTR